MITDRYYGIKICPKCGKHFVISTRNYDPKEKNLCFDCKIKRRMRKEF